MSIKKNALVLTLFDVLSEVSDNPLARGSERLRNIRFPKFNKRNIFRYLLPAVLILVAVFIVRQALVPNPQVGNTVIGVSDTKPLATTTLHREFQFPLRNEKGKEVGNLKQHLRIETFVGTTENAVQVQIWIALRIFLIIN